MEEMTSTEADERANRAATMMLEQLDALNAKYPHVEPLLPPEVIRFLLVSAIAQVLASKFLIVPPKE